MIIPFRAESEDRQEILDFVLARYSAFWPELEIIVSDSDDEEFSRSAARNRGVERAEGDMLILADADTICNPYELEKATTMASMSNRWVLPYGPRGYWNLTRGYTRQLLNADPTAPVFPRNNGFDFDHRIESWAGILVMPRRAFEAVNGYDERFRGWGYEDNAFRTALDTIWGSHIRVTDGDVYHLYHDVPDNGGFNSPNIQFNRDRYYNDYRRASKSKERMLKLVEGNR